MLKGSWNKRCFQWIKEKLVNLFLDKPICRQGEWRLELVEKYIKLYDSLDYAGYEIEMEISEVQARQEIYKKIDTLSIISALIAIVTNIIKDDIINQINNKAIMVILVFIAAFLLIIFSIKLACDSNAYKRWWFIPYFICTIVFTIMAWGLEIWGIFAFGCSAIIIFIILNAYISFLSTKCRARLVALNYLKMNHDIK